MMAKDWIKSLKPGDLVIQRNCWLGREEIDTVESISWESPRTWLITLKSGARFTQLGDSAPQFAFGTPKDSRERRFIHEATEEALAAIKRRGDDEGLD